MPIETVEQQDQFIKLIGLSTFLEQQVSLEESLEEIMAMAANILQTANCSIMLFREDEESGGFHLRMFAKYGDFPQTAYSEVVKVNSGIAGRVAATGQALLVQDIEKSVFLPLARRPESTNKSFICVPIVINSKVIGVMNVSNPIDGRCFDNSDLNLSIFVTLLIGKSVQVIQLQNLLKSRFAQLAIAQEAKEIISEAITPTSYDAGRIVKMLAKSFFREMTRAGFERNHVITAATELISLLSENLERHDRRLNRV